MSASEPASAPATRAAFVRAENDDPQLEFRAFKTMAYQRRVRWIGGLAAAGLLVQILTLSPWYGLPLVVAAAVLSWVAGHDTRVDRRAFHHDRAWETVPFDRVREVKRLDEKMHAWDYSPIDISNTAGAWLLILTLGGLVLLWVVLVQHQMERAAAILALDAAVLLLPQWFNGMRWIDRQPDLIVTVDALLSAVRGAERGLGEAVELKAQMLMSGKGDDRTPEDARLVIAWKDAPETFYGVQGQVVLNRVQGTPYPYFYAVVVAKEGQGLLRAAETIDLPPEVVRELDTKDGVDIAVIRQKTTNTSGYHVESPRDRVILDRACDIAQAFLAARPAAS